MKKWSPSAEYCASVLHMVAAISIVQAASRQGYNMWWTCIILAIVTAVKEFWADRTWLENDSLRGSALDFSCYIIGMGAAAISLSMFWLSVALITLAIVVAMLIDMKSQDVL